MSPSGPPASEPRPLHVGSETSAPTGAPLRVRCVCQECGAHTLALLYLTARDFCLNCGSHDLRPLSDL